MAGENVTFSIKQYGRRRAVLRKVSFGLLMVIGDTSMSRYRQAFSVNQVKSPGFVVDLVFSSHRAHEDFMLWMQDYMRRASDPDRVPHPVRVTIPSRRFDKMGILRGGVTFGDRVGKAVYPATLTFIEISDLLLLNNSSRSTFELPEAEDPALPYLYPAGSQLSGTLVGNDAEFDTAPPPINRGGPR